MVVVLGFFTTLFGEVNPDTLPEKYVKKEIIKAKWGGGEGKFGLEPLPESNEYVTCFTVAPNGNIYILDPNNGKINVFDKGGRFVMNIPIPLELIYTYAGQSTSLVEGIGVDSRDNLYLASSSAFNVAENGELVVKLDTKGNIIKRYIFKGVYIWPPYFYEDKDGEMYLWGSWQKST